MPLRSHTIRFIILRFDETATLRRLIRRLRHCFAIDTRCHDDTYAMPDTPLRREFIYLRHFR